MPAARLKSSLARCGGVPIPGEPKFSAPGFAFASATSSRTEVAGTRGLHGQQQRAVAPARDRREIGQRVVAGAGEQVRVEGGRALVDEQQRVAVRRAARHLRGADIAACGGVVLDEHRLAEGLAQPLGEPARADVGDAAHAAGHDPDRPRRPGRAWARAAGSAEAGHAHGGQQAARRRIGAASAFRGSSSR